MAQILHRTVFPDADDHEIRGLYVTGDDGARISGRESLVVSAGARASLATYFNAFPAAYWAHETEVRRVRLEIRAAGAGTATVHGSDADGSVRTLGTMDLGGGEAHLEIPLDGFDPGGWVWFDVAAAATSELTLVGAMWTTESAPRRPAIAALGITTMNKPGYCVRTLGALATAPELREHVARVFVVDQGSRLVEDEDGFAAAREALGTQLAMLRQPNLGGSGGFARSMLETLRLPGAEFALLLDDDVEIEPEALRRLIVFGAHCTSPTIVGGHMIDLLSRTRLYAWAEVVDEKPFMWRPRHAERMPIDLAQGSLPELPLVHERMDADYNGWWMCLVPREVVERIGLPIPAFLKWDDAEYSLRAGEAGFRTVSLPGAAIWHVSWVGKDDQIDWQAYFHIRNRLVAALLHSRIDHGGTVLEHSRRVDIKHFLAMQYYPVDLRHRALRAVLSGPDHLHAELGTVLGGLRSLADAYPETRAMTDPPPITPVPAWPDDLSDTPSGARLMMLMVRSLVRDWFRRPRSAAQARAEIAVPARQARWWRLARYDSAAVEMAGTGEVRLYRRDRAIYRRQLAESLRLHRELRRRWSGLQRDYAAADLTSVDAWEHTFAEAGSHAP